MEESYAPPSPRKLPAYKPPTIEAQRPPSPTATQEHFKGGLIAPMGCELAVHNVYPTESLATSAEVMDYALRTIHKAHPELTPVSAAFKLKDTPTLCTIKLRGDVLLLDAKPRPDLLEPWIGLLRSHHSEWEVNWACANPNKDKRLWVVLKGVDGTVDKGSVDQARQELQRQGFRSVGGFFMGSSGSVVVNMESLRLAQNLRNKKSIKIPKLGKYPLLIDRFPIVQPEWAFELIITGLEHYDATVKLVLDDYFSRTYVKDGQTLWHCSRIVEDAYYCFLMRDWESTLQVLGEKDKFEAMCSATLPNLGFPRQVYEVNTVGGFHESIARKLKMAATSVSGNLTDVQAQIHNLRRDVERGFDQVDKRIDAQQKDLRSLTNSVSTLNDRVLSQSHSLLALHRSTILQEQKSALDMTLMHKTLMFHVLSPEEKEVARAEMNEIQKRGKQIETELETVRAASRNLAVPSLPPPQETREPAVAANLHIPQPQVVMPTQTHNVPAEEPQPKKQATRSTGRNTQNSRNAPVKKRKTADTPVESSQASVFLSQTPVIYTQAQAPPQAPMVSSQFGGVLDDDFEMVPESQEQVKSILDTNETHANVTLRQVTTTSAGPETFEKTSLSDDPLSSDVVTCRRVPKCLSTGYRSYAQSMKFSWGWVLLLLMLCLQIQTSAAMAATQNGMSFYALNANGMVNIGKLSQIGNTLNIRRPHIFTISETKTSDKVGSKLNVEDYNFFEETGVKMDNHHLYKWGIVVGIRKDIQVAQRIQVTAALKGRVVALDLVIGTDAGKGFVHRFVGIYAPWNPGSDTNDNGFWNEVAKICNEAAFSWSVAGDLNATVSTTERTSGGTDARKHFLQFLHKTKGVDLWSAFKPERSRLHDWTCKAHSNRTALGNIIDRVVTSSNCIVDADIAVAEKPYDFIQMTDHRAVTATLLMKPPDNTTGSPNIPIDLIGAIHHPRVKYPSKKDKMKFETYQKRVDERIETKGLAQRTVTGDVSFTQRYNELTEIIVGTAKEVFGVTRKIVTEEKRISSPSIRRLEKKLRHIGGALYLEKRGQQALVSEESRKELTCLRHEYENERNNSPNQGTLRDYMIKRRRSTYKELYHERMKEIIERARTRDRQKIGYSLRFGSTKKLVRSGDYVGLPTAVNSHRDPGVIRTDPEGVKTATCDYLNDLYNREQPPKVAKPWLTTPSVLEVKQRVLEEPFEWPRRASLQDFRAMLRRGNQRPSPGPDGWEKWCVKNLSDTALKLVLDLHNYEVANASFPGNVKDMTCTMFHKRNLITDLSNWRGIMLSNFIANTPMTWLTNLLTSYSSKLNIIPETQVATQQGVQTRDVISYLSAIKCFAQRNNLTLYALQRDQMKGFDYLAPQGFYDALEAYGLPAAIADLDRAAQANTKVFVRTAYGVTGPITVDAVTKQGGPASPLKSVLTTSLGHRYLDDMALKEKGTLILKTEAKLKGLAPHTPDHNLQARVTMVEATDDSIIFARDLETLQKFTLLMERFQYAYGWITSWKKTVAYGICLQGDNNSNPSSVRMPSITLPENGYYDERKVTWQEVPLRVGELMFLRARVDDTAFRFAELQDYIKNFRFPKFTIQTPITLARKIISQNIISKCRALLSLQPIKQPDAEQLDRLISGKVHELLRFPFCPQTNILTLPLSCHGLDFPSIARINAGIVAEGLMRDLNHHIQAYRTVARITYADWACRYNSCCHPVDGIGLQKKFSHLYGKIPATWLIAHSLLSATKPNLCLRLTDVSFLGNGEVSISHVANICKSHGLQEFGGTAANCLSRVGITMLSHLGHWGRNINGAWLFIARNKPSTSNWTEATHKSWDKALSLLLNTSLSWLFQGEEDLIRTRRERRSEAENQIRVLARLFELSPSPHIADRNLWASDGSMTPASAGIMDDKSVTAALTGPITMVMKLGGRNSNILHGEVFGLVMGHILGRPNQDNVLYTDHLNTVRFLQDASTCLDQEKGLRYRNGRSYLRWLMLLSKEANVQVTYTKGHSDNRSLESKLNSAADHYAVIAQKHIHSIPIAPIPTFTMNDYTYYQDSDGWIESNVRVYMDQLLVQKIVRDLSFGHRQRMATWLYHKSNPPSFIYHKATSAYTAAVQLYARSGQLATAEKVEERQANGNGTRCRLGCLNVENEHHIFVSCPEFDKWRETAGKQLRKTVEERLSKLELDDDLKNTFLYKAEFFFADEPITWPLKESRYYLGHVPILSDWLPQTVNGTSRLLRERIIHGVYGDWHNAGVRLASRIFGELQRRVTRSWDQERRRNFD